MFNGDKLCHLLLLQNILRFQKAAAKSLFHLPERAGCCPDHRRRRGSSGEALQTSHSLAALCLCRAGSKPWLATDRLWGTLCLRGSLAVVVSILSILNPMFSCDAQRETHLRSRNRQRGAPVFTLQPLVQAQGPGWVPRSHPQGVTTTTPL